MLTLALLVAALLAILWFANRRRGGRTSGADDAPGLRVADARDDSGPAADAVAPVTAGEAPAPAAPPPAAAPIPAPSVPVPPVTAASVPEPEPEPEPVAEPAAPKPRRRAKAPKAEAAPKPAARAAKAGKAAASAPSAPAPAAVTAIGIPGAVGAPDDLLMLKGIGPKLGALLTTLEIRRFDQIAAWGPAEIAVVDEHLGAFKGRIARDAWVEQAGFLARGDIAGYEAKFGKLDGGVEP